MSSIDLSARIQAAANACRNLGITQSQIAHDLGASQSQVSRILGGQSHRRSRLAEEICLYVERFSGDGVSADAVRMNNDLVQAVQSVWDGSAGHAKAISTVIRALAVLRDPEPAARQRTKGQR